MGKRFQLKQSFLLPAFFLFFTTLLLAQDPKLPKKVYEPKQVIEPPKTVVKKKDTEPYVIAPPTVTANTTIATAGLLVC